MDGEDIASPEPAPEDRGRGWTWYSSFESVEAAKVSVLGVLETIAACAVFAWIAKNWGTQHLLVSACIALSLRLSRHSPGAIRKSAQNC